MKNNLNKKEVSLGDIWRKLLVLEETVENGFRSVANEFSNVENRFNNIDRKFLITDSRLDSVEENVSKLTFWVKNAHQRRFENIEDSLRKINTKLKLN